MRANHEDILATIRDEQALSDETDAKLKSTLENYAKNFSAA
jgi:F0F1-type ATP synthase alpha subunit